MKNFRQFCATAVLTSVLTFSAYAGEIQTGKATPPPVPTATLDGEIQTGITSTSGTTNSGAVDPVAEMALLLLQSILSLF